MAAQEKLGTGDEAAAGSSALVCASLPISGAGQAIGGSSSCCRWRPRSRADGLARELEAALNHPQVDTFWCLAKWRKFIR